MQNIGLIRTRNGATVVTKNKTYTISREDKRFNRVVEAYASGDEEALDLALKNEQQTFQHFISKEEDFEFSQDKVTYKGKEINNALVSKIKTMIEQSAPDLAPLKAFLTRLYGNVSAASISELYNFLEYKELAITPDGYFIAYRGVGSDFYSHKGNLKTVVKQGKVDAQGRILNEVGAIIEVDRNQVDDNRSVHCSFGLHVGSYDYAKNWAGGGKVLLVKVDPADVVSVPNDCNCQKARVCKFEVLSEYAEEVKAAVVSVAEAKDPKSIKVREKNQGNPAFVFKDRVQKYINRRAEQGWDYTTLRQVQSSLSPDCPKLLSLLSVVEGLNVKFEIDKKVLGDSYITH